MGSLIRLQRSQTGQAPYIHTYHRHFSNRMPGALSTWQKAHHLFRTYCRSVAAVGALEVEGAVPSTRGACLLTRQFEARMTMPQCHGSAQ